MTTCLQQKSDNIITQTAQKSYLNFIHYCEFFGSELLEIMQNWETKSTILIKFPFLRRPDDDAHLSTLPLADYRIRTAPRHAHAAERYGSTIWINR